MWRAGGQQPPAIALAQHAQGWQPECLLRWALHQVSSAGPTWSSTMHHPPPDPTAGLEFGGTKKVVLLSGLHFAGQVFPSQKKRKRITFQNSFPSLWREKSEVEPNSCYYAWFKEIRSSSKRERLGFIVSTLKIVVKRKPKPGKASLGVAPYTIAKFSSWHLEGKLCLSPPWPLSPKIPLYTWDPSGSTPCVDVSGRQVTLK